MLNIIGKTCLRINYSQFSGLKIISINNQMCILLNNTSYCLVPKTFSVSFYKEYFELNGSTKEDMTTLQRIKQKLERVVSNGSFAFKRSLYLKGLGYRMLIDKDARLLTLKLGKSHLFNIKWPEFVLNIRVTKNLIYVESRDCARLGDFMHHIYNLYPVDAYKGKGFSFPYVNVKLKEVKKK